ncbi:MAG: TatD family hydrolase [Treponema sp.]|nr:TatD family hydrolase [Treponema sp.]
MTDAHCHPWNLLEHDSNAEDERRNTGTACAASAWNLEQFEYHERLAQNAGETGGPRMFCCFAVHPQLPALGGGGVSPAAGLEILWSLAADGRVDAVGETGFDLYGEKFRATEKMQDELFAGHLKTAFEYGLPLVIHARRAMHKVFPFASCLKKLPAVVFHSWPGTRGEGESLLRRGINVFFSFGAAVLNNHREAMSCAACFPADRILLETDAPYQPVRGRAFSSWRDLEQICSRIAALRKQAHSPGGEAGELAALTTANFFRALGRG